MDITAALRKFRNREGVGLTVTSKPRAPEGKAPLAPQDPKPQLTFPPLHPYPPLSTKARRVTELHADSLPRRETGVSN